MTAAREFAKLRVLSDRPEVNEEAWLSSAPEATEFLKENARSSDVLIYASMPHVFIHGVLVPTARVSPPDVDDLMRAHFDPDDSWVIQRAYGGGEGHRVYLEPPMTHPGCNSLAGSEKLIFRRPFDGMKNYRAPIEISQKVVHALGVHFMEARGAYCRLNDDGDLEDVISVIADDADDPWESSRAVFIKSRDLAEFMALSETVLFRKFDFTRTKPSFDRWKDHGRTTHTSPDLSFNSGIGEAASYANGYHISRTNLTADDLSEEWRSSLDSSTKQYEVFKIFDWKNDRLAECSAGPDSRANYFTKSEKPFDVSPVFFRPEVLHKYKADPDKYTLEHRSITCRNAWYLKTFDINAEGQVHTYICYLADLPYSEQQYWKLYNEWPKGPISARAYQTDFEGEYSTEPDPLVELEYGIEKLERSKPTWWSIRSADARPRVLYPATISSKEWADEILALDQLLVEGFYTKGLKGLAAKLALALDKDWASLRIVEACLAEAGMRADVARETVEPLRELHHLRSKVRGHATTERKRLEDAAQKEHGSLRAQFIDLAQRCAESFAKIAPTLQAIDERMP